jgi:hypothetical protein
VDVVKVKAVDAVMANVLPAVLAPNPEETARRAAPTLVSPRMAQAQRTTAHLARKPPVVTAQSAAHATQHLLACPTTTLITSPHRITKKMISNPAQMRI